MLSSVLFLFLLLLLLVNDKKTTALEFDASASLFIAIRFSLTTRLLSIGPIQPRRTFSR